MKNICIICINMCKFLPILWAGYLECPYLGKPPTLQCFSLVFFCPLAFRFWLGDLTLTCQRRASDCRLPSCILFMSDTVWLQHTQSHKHMKRRQTDELTDWVTESFREVVFFSFDGDDRLRLFGKAAEGAKLLPSAIVLNKQRKKSLSARCSVFMN